MNEYFAQNADDDCEFYLFKSEDKRDAFIRKHHSYGWKFGRVVNGVEITDGWV